MATANDCPGWHPDGALCNVRQCMPGPIPEGRTVAALSAQPQGERDLPPLPAPMKHGPFGGLYTGHQMRDYARASLSASSAVSAEPDMRAICEALGFDPTNHHNAAKCPYCRPAVSAEARDAARWVAGEPPEGVDVAWLHLRGVRRDEEGATDEIERVVLGVKADTYVGGGHCESLWHESADWMGESYNDCIHDDGDWIVAWMPHHIPRAAMAPPADNKENGNGG